MATELENLGAACGDNPDRARVILARVKELVRDQQPISTLAIDAACIFLPGWEACTDEEATAAFAVIEAEANAHADKLEAEAAATEQPEGNIPPADVTVKSEPAETPTIDRDAALASLNEEIKLREAARSALNVAIRKQQELRGKLADLLQVWQTGPRITHRQALMKVSATQRTTKQQQMGTVPGPSAWDRQAYYSAGRGPGNAPSFVAKQMRGGGNRRGSLPLSAARGPMDTAGKSKVQLRRTDTGASS